MKPEDRLQIAVATYLRAKYPETLWCHIANERQTSPQRGAKLKKMGVRAGMPDVMVFRRSGTNKYIGLAIELKVGNNKPTEAQYDVMYHLKCLGWFTAFCWSFDEAQKIIDEYINGFTELSTTLVP